MTPPEFDVRPVEDAEVAAAHAVWLASNAARGRNPSAERRARVHHKLANPEATVVVVRQAGAVIGMARAEALRVDDGDGPLVPGWGHIDMLFVHPDRWGEGVGGSLLDRLHRHLAAQGQAIEWNGVKVTAWAPHALDGQTFEVGVSTARRTERAIAAARATGGLPQFGTLAMLVLRAEGVASSFIEGVRTPLVDVAAAEIDATANPNARLVADNLAAVIDALGAPQEDLMVRSEHLMVQWHSRLHDLHHDAAARRSLDLLGRYPVLSSGVLAEQLGVTERTARSALITLGDRGIVQPYEPTPMHAGRPRRFWVAGELLALVSGWPGS